MNEAEKDVKKFSRKFPEDPPARLSLKIEPE